MERFRYIKGEFAMKAFTKLMAMMILPFILTACIGSSSTSTTATTPPPPPISEDLTQKINMRAAIYQTYSSHPGFTSGKLTLTTDSVDTDVYGKYSVIKDGILVSSGTVSGTTKKLFLFSSYTSNCKESLSIYPLSSTSNSTKVQIYGKNCSGESIVATEYIKKVNTLPNVLPTVTAKTRVSGQNNVDMTVSASTADNVTFLGMLSLNNENIELVKLDKTNSSYAPWFSAYSSSSRKTAIATVVGFSTYSSNNTVRSAKDGVNYVQLKVTNFSGHLFSKEDVLTFPENVAASQTYIRFKQATTGYEIDRFNVYISDLTQSILFGNNPSDELTSTLIPYSPQ